MGNNQGGFHKRERTNDGSQRHRPLGTGSHPTPSTASVGDDGCPVQVRRISEELDLLSIIRKTIS